MIVTISGDPGSGKSAVGRAIAEKLGLKQYSGGKLMREIAEKRNISLAELLKIAETDFSIDKDVDNKITALGKEDDNFILDSRTAFHFIPKSVKIFLRTDAKKAAERIWKDIQEGKRKTERQFKSLKEVYRSIIKRQESESGRYKKYYNVDHLDMSNYDFVLDATNLSLDEEIQKVLDYIKKIK